MNGNVHVRFWSRAGMAPSRLRQRRQVIQMPPEREVCQGQSAATRLGIIQHASRESRVRGTLARAVRRGADTKGSGNRDLAGGLPDS